MEPQKRVKQLLNPHVLLPIIAALIALVLIVLVCIFASEANSVQNEYALHIRINYDRMVEIPAGKL